MRKLTIVLILVLIMIAALLGYYAPTIISYFQNVSQSSDASYTNLTLRAGINDTTTIGFGDTDYTFHYFQDSIAGTYISVSTFVGGGKWYNSVHIGDIFKDLGVEIKVANITSDYISSYIVILVKPTVQNYSASLMYTKVNLTVGQAKTVSISSGLVNKTNQYFFTYTRRFFNGAEFTISTGSQFKTYVVSEGGGVTDFDIEVKIYKIDSEYMVIYVKPLY